MHGYVGAFLREAFSESENANMRCGGMVGQMTCLSDLCSKIGYDIVSGEECNYVFFLLFLRLVWVFGS